MKRMSVLGAGVLALVIATSGFAQTYPSNGYIGVFADAAGTSCCATAPTFVPTTLYVIAVLGGQLSGGITGAEFRLVFESMTGYLPPSFAANPQAGVVIGNPIDTTPADPNDPYGLNIAFSECQGANAGDHVLLGTVSIINLGTGAPSDITVRRKLPPQGVLDCPVLVDCVFPFFNQYCLTIQTPDVPPGDPYGEPVIFKSTLNKPCDTPNCGAIAVAPRTWSSVKDLYR